MQTFLLELRRIEGTQNEILVYDLNSEIEEVNKLILKENLIERLWLELDCEEDGVQVGKEKDTSGEETK